MPWLSGSENCRIRMMSSGKFDFACRGSNPWSGIGRWTLEDRRGERELVLEFDVAQIEGRSHLDEVRPVRMGASHEGNRMRLRLDGSELVWDRRMNPP